MQLESEAVVTYQEKTKVENESFEKGSKISWKMLFVKSMSDFLKMKKKDLVSLKEHSVRICYSQYSGFKKASTKTMNSEGDAVTLHIDWSQNVRRKECLLF